MRLFEKCSFSHQVSAHDICKEKSVIMSELVSYGVLFSNFFFFLIDTIEIITVVILVK